MSDTPEAAPVLPPPPLPATPLRSALGGFFADLALAIVICFALMMAGGVIAAVLQGIRMAMTGAGEEEVLAALTQPGALIQILIVLFSMGGTALLLYFWRRPASLEERRRSRAAIMRMPTWLAIVGIALLTFAASTAATWLGERMGTPPNPSNLAVIREASSQAPLFLMLFAVALAPLYEELLFRRVLFGRLWQAGYPLLGVLLSGIAFAFAHEIPGLTGNGPVATILLLTVYAAMGMAFAWLYRRTGTLWAPIAAHALNNALAMAALRVFGS